jgi:hypothetical protein
VDLYEVALPLIAGNEESFGKGDTAEVTPLKSGHHAEVTREHVRGLWRPDSIAEAALKDWAGIQAWAREYAVEAPQGEAPARGEQSYEAPPF